MFGQMVIRHPGSEASAPLSHCHCHCHEGVAVTESVLRPMAGLMTALSHGMWGGYMAEQTSWW